MVQSLVIWDSLGQFGDRKLTDKWDQKLGKHVVKPKCYRLFRLFFGLLQVKSDN